MATKCKFWLTTETRCRKSAEWRFGAELDFCKEHYDMAVADVPPEPLKLLNPRTIR